MEPDHQKQRLVSELLTTKLQPLFDAAAYSREQRHDFVDRLTASILAVDTPEARLPEPLKLPEAAPVKWKDRAADDTPATFFGRVYQPWIGRITKNELRALDPTLVTKINEWVREGNSWPEDLPLPRLHKSRSEMQELLAKVEGGQVDLDAHLSSFSGREALREYRRIAKAKDKAKENSLG